MLTEIKNTSRWCMANKLNLNFTKSFFLIIPPYCI